MSRPSAAQTAARDTERTADYRRLLTAILERLDAGDSMPCLGPDGLMWTSADDDEQEAAAHQCQRCPVLAVCGTYISRHREISGVWAGTTPTERHSQ